jgi:hypothetical protein
MATLGLSGEPRLASRSDGHHYIHEDLGIGINMDFSQRASPILDNQYVFENIAFHEVLHFVIDYKKISENTWITTMPLGSKDAYALRHLSIYVGQTQHSSFAKAASTSPLFEKNHYAHMYNTFNSIKNPSIRYAAYHYLLAPNVPSKFLPKWTK